MGENEEEDERTAAQRAFQLRQIVAQKMLAMDDKTRSPYSWIWEDEGFEAYVEKQMEAGEWGDTFGIFAATFLFERQIILYAENRRQDTLRWHRQVFNGIEQFQDADPIILLHQGGNHFNALV